MTSYTVTEEGLTLDMICWRVLGATSGVVEQALLLNPHLALVGEILPLGTSLVLPEPQPAEIPLFRLWD